MKAIETFKYSPDGISVVIIQKGDELSGKALEAAQRLGLVKEPEKETKTSSKPKK